MAVRKWSSSNLSVLRDRRTFEMILIELNPNWDGAPSKRWNERDAGVPDCEFEICFRNYSILCVKCSIVFWVGRGRVAGLFEYGIYTVSFRRIERING